jgi:hypothetical protein
MEKDFTNFGLAGLQTKKGRPNIWILINEKKTKIRPPTRKKTSIRE